MRKKSKMKGVRRGQTIVAEREYAESDSERMRARKKAHRKKKTSIIIVGLMLAILGLLSYMWVEEFSEGQQESETGAEVYAIRAEVIDEDNRGQISARVKAYIAELELDLSNLGYTVVRVTLPTGTSRELYVDLEGNETYFKVNVDRGAGVSAEDIDRMVKYLAGKDLKPEYVDVRVDGKAYYK